MMETRTKRIIPRRYDIKGRFQMQGGKIWSGYELKKTGARSARARMRGQNPLV
jgi:hypothetical protein